MVVHESDAWPSGLAWLRVGSGTSGLSCVERPMQPHEQHDPEKPGPGDRTTKRLLLVIAILLGLVASQVVKRLM
jgi:hypothetical protein